MPNFSPRLSVVQVEEGHDLAPKFDTLADTRRKLAICRYDYNNVRPHSSLANKTPTEARRALEQSEGSAPARLPNPKPTTIKPKDSRYERGTTGGQVRLIEQKATAS